MKLSPVRTTYKNQTRDLLFHLFGILVFLVVISLWLSVFSRWNSVKEKLHREPQREIAREPQRKIAERTGVRSLR